MSCVTNDNQVGMWFCLHGRAEQTFVGKNTIDKTTKPMTVRVLQQLCVYHPLKQHVRKPIGAPRHHEGSCVHRSATAA